MSPDLSVLPKMTINYSKLKEVVLQVRVDAKVKN